MSQHEALVRLRHMRDYGREAVVIISGKGRSDLDQDRLLVLSLTRLLEILGESANRVPVDVQRRHPGLPWREMIGLRNRLIHGYDAVDLDVVWQILSVDLPALLPILDQVIAEEEEDT